MAKLEYIHTFPVKEEMRSRSIHYCDYCPLGSKSIFFMLNHLRRHCLPSHLFDCAVSNVEPYCCKNCDINFDSIIHLRIHIQEQHSENEKVEDYAMKSYICRTCFFPTSSALECFKHVKAGCLEWDSQRKLSPNLNTVKTVQNEPENKSFISKQLGVFNCSQCEYKSKCKRYLLIHQSAKHEMEVESKMWFHCEKCTYKTGWKSVLKRHNLARHTGDKSKKWFKCEKCIYKATVKCNLTRHNLAKHTDDKSKQWFSCEKCTFKASVKSYLQKHVIAKHVDDKDRNDKDRKWFHCEKCNYKGTYKCRLDKHILSKHTNDKDIKWFYCEKCTYKAKWKSYLNMHMISKHSNGKDESVTDDKM